MSITALISGSLFRGIDQKTSRNDKAYLSATLKVGGRKDGFFVRLFVFSESVCDEMEGLAGGDGLAVVGALSVEIYENKLSYSMVVSRALALKKERRAAKSQTETKAPQHVHTVDEFGDAVPF